MFKFYTIDIHNEIVKLWQNQQFYSFLLDNFPTYQMSSGTQYLINHFLLKYDFQGLNPIHCTFPISHELFLHCEKRLFAGVYEEIIQVENFKHHIVLVRGARNERKKWIHCFESVGAYFYFVNLTAYATAANENGNATMKDLIENFKLYANHKKLNYCKMYLLFTNFENFVSMLHKFPVNLQFPEFTGTCSGNVNTYGLECVEFFANLFLNAIEDPEKKAIQHQ